MLAGMTATPELNMSEPEAKLITDASQKVARHYVKGNMPEKVLDWTNLITALSAVYVPRMMAAKIRMASEAARDVTPVQVPTVQTATQQPPRDQAAQDFVNSQILHAASGGIE